MPTGIDDPSRGGCPYDSGPYRKAWVQGWWRHFHRQTRSTPIFLYWGFHRAWTAGWDYFEHDNVQMTHGLRPVTATDR